MLWTLSALLPIIVAFSDWWMGHWRRSVENLWIMRKVFFYLLFMVLILPSIGLTSLRAAFEIVFQDRKNTEVSDLFLLRLKSTLNMLQRRKKKCYHQNGQQIEQLRPNFTYSKKK